MYQEIIYLYSVQRFPWLSRFSFPFVGQLQFPLLSVNDKYYKKMNFLLTTQVTCIRINTFWVRHSYQDESIDRTSNHAKPKEEWSKSL